MRPVLSVRRFTQLLVRGSYVAPMTSTAAEQTRTQPTSASPLACGARRRPPLGIAPASTSHGDLRDRLLSCNG